MYIEHEGQLYRGPARGVPEEVWSAQAKAFKPYKGSSPKGVEWGEEISEEDAHRFYINREA